ncbi:MAG: DUF1801 domain-containing protein [Flavobacteriales bacterium]|nr:DUF1801 domain-containing protein [Flavobacteriales bacterium]
MRIEANDPEEYIQKAPEERRPYLLKMREVIQNNIPDGFEEGFSYGFPAWVVPLSVYPDGYHCKKEEPLPFISYASQKNFVALYHMGLYANPELMEWFVAEYPKHCSTKLDMGKSCIRFKKPEKIPFELIGELVRRMSSEEWISIYEANIKR